MRSLVLCLLLAVLLVGCTTVRYRDSTGRELSISSQFKSTGIDGAKVTTPEGGSLEVTGYKSDATKAIDLATAALNAASRVP